MICADCGERPAAVFIRRSGSRPEAPRGDLALCEDCARARGVVAGSAGLDLRLEGFLGSLLGEEEGSRVRRLSCAACGSDSGILREGRLGCPSCAEAFRTELRRRFAARDAARPRPVEASRSPSAPAEPAVASAPSSLPFPLSLPAFATPALAPPDADIVLRSFVRFSRCLEGLPFPGSPSGGPAPSGGAIAALLASDPGWEARRLVEMAKDERLALSELIPLPRTWARGASATFAASRSEPLYALEDETDHLRIFARLPGLALAGATALAASLADRLEARCGESLGRRWARDPEFGLLCATLEDCGAGFSASVLLHLPALAMTGLQDKLFRALMSGGVQVRGAYAEEGPSIGSLFELSAGGAAGGSGAAIAAALESAAATAVAAERRTRAELARREGLALLDAAGRALGILSHCRRVGVEEAAALLSALRLACLAGLLSGAEPGRLGSLLGRLGPGALALAAGEAPAGGRSAAAELDADALRALYLRGEVAGIAIAGEEDRCSRA